jgi:tripartite-type tricarboxylate transporter receptor subunit TctC
MRSRLLNRGVSIPLALILLAVISEWVQPLDSSGAAKYPAKPVTVIVPAATGGSMDNTTRAVQPYVQKHLGITVVVSNLPGASGVIGANKVYDSPADGYTLLAGTNAHLQRFRLMANQTHFGGDMNKAFIPIGSWLNGDANAMCVRKDSPYKTFDDLVAKAKKEGVTVGLSGGVGAMDHLLVLVIGKVYGGQWTVIPFLSGGEVAAALLGGHIDSGCLGLAGAADPAKFKLLVHSGSIRLPELPDVPTFVELGKKSLDMGYCVGAMAKQGTDPEIVRILEDAFVKAANDPGFRNWAKETKTPIGEPRDAKAWGEFMKNADASLVEIMPMLEEALKKTQSGK